MNRKDAKALLMDYLYDEIEPDEKKQLEEYLDTDPTPRKELNQLQQTRQLLRNNPLTVGSDQRLVVLETDKRSFSEWIDDAKILLPRTIPGKAIFAIAASLILILIIGSVANLHINYSNSGLSVSLGSVPDSNIQTGLTAEQADRLVNQIQQQNNILLADYAESIYQENQKQLKDVVDYFHQQRIDDLRLIDQNLNQLQEVNNYRWLQTNEFLGEIVQTVDHRENE